MSYQISIQMTALGTGDDADAYFERISWIKQRTENSIPRYDFWPLIGLEVQVKISSYFLINWSAQIHMYANISGKRYFLQGKTYFYMLCIALAVTCKNALSE